MTNLVKKCEIKETKKKWKKMYRTAIDLVLCLVFKQRGRRKLKQKLFRDSYSFKPEKEIEFKQI